jgi:hypothetical protein
MEDFLTQDLVSNIYLAKQNVEWLLHSKIQNYLKM